MKYSVITISDTCYNKTATDTSGPHLKALINEKLECSDVHYLVIPDVVDLIKQSLVYCADVLQVNAIFTTGGTGFAPRDVTPEATKAIITKEAPQLAFAIMLKSLEKTKFAVLSRGICGIRNRTLIVNFPGSTKAVEECFMSIVDVIPHILQLLIDDVPKVKQTHVKIQSGDENKHVCPHLTGKGLPDDRNSPYPMLEVDDAIRIIMMAIPNISNVRKQISRVNIPPFRASIKDGYALRSIGGKGVKRVVGYISAGDGIVRESINIEDCYKINTGAPIPDNADAVVQIEDTKLISCAGDLESIVEILVDPVPNLDIRSIGSDLRMAEEVFQYSFPMDASQRALLAAIGEQPNVKKLHISVISTGDELIAPDSVGSNEKFSEGKIYDSNTTMLTALLDQFGFTKDQCTVNSTVVKDNYEQLKHAVQTYSASCHAIICTGGVSMGDKDFVKPVLNALGYEVKFGRVNMKPGKPFTFACDKSGTLFFGLPGNPVSAFVTFHIFVLPALRKCLATLNDTPSSSARSLLPKLSVELLTDKYHLDPRPEFARATIISKNDKLYAKICGKQISSRLKSVIDADVLLQLPACTEAKPYLSKGEGLTALVIRSNFISSYE